MRYLFLLIIFSSLSASAQVEQSVMKPIHALFDAMKTGDSASIRKVFHPAAVLFTVVKDPTTNEPVLRKETLAEFLKAVGTPHKDVYNELTWGEKVFIDGDFAQVWTDYAFFLNKTFNHCGVDAFQLIRNTKGEWLIYGLSDTRRKTGCQVPAEVRQRAEK